MNGDCKDLRLYEEAEGEEKAVGADCGGTLWDMSFAAPVCSMRLEWLSGRSVDV